MIMTFRCIYVDMYHPTLLSIIATSVFLVITGMFLSIWGLTTFNDLFKKKTPLKANKET